MKGRDFAFEKYVWSEENDLVGFSRLIAVGDSLTLLRVSAQMMSVEAACLISWYGIGRGLRDAQ